MRIVAKFIKRVQGTDGPNASEISSEVIVREDGGMLDIEQDGEVIELSAAQAIALRPILLDAVTE